MDFNYLIHYGMPRRSGRYPWGSGNRPYQRTKISKNIKVDNVLFKRPSTRYNIKKWGINKNNNILFITGIAGSGKSTLANKISKTNNADYINIDLYTFKTADKYINEMSKSFNRYLDKNIPSWKKMQKNAYEVLTKNDRRSKKPAGLWFDTFEKALLDYGKEMYGTKKVVAEGVQILDETLFYKNKKFLKDKPLIIMDTSVEQSIASRIKRDNKSIDKLLEPERVRQLEGWVKDLNILKKNMKDIY